MDFTLNDFIIGLEKDRDKFLRSIYKKYFPIALSYIIKNKGSRDDAKDVFQEALIAVLNYTKRETVKKEIKLEVYLLAVCRFMWLKHMRKSRTDWFDEHDINIEYDKELVDSIDKNLELTMFQKYFRNKEIKNQIKISLNEISTKLINNLRYNPSDLYIIPPDKFEILVAEILSDMGYEIKLTPKTRDGGRDILALLNTPLGKTLTIVECKRYAPDHIIGIGQVERLLWIATRNDNSNSSMFVTTSFFSNMAKKIEKDYSWILKLKDYYDVCEWLDKYGTWKRDESAGIWMPRYI